MSYDNDFNVIPNTQRLTRDGGNVDKEGGRNDEEAIRSLLEDICD